MTSRTGRGKRWLTWAAVLSFIAAILLAGGMAGYLVSYIMDIQGLSRWIFTALGAVALFAAITVAINRWELREDDEC